MERKYRKVARKINRKIKEELGLSKSLIPDQVLQAVTTIFNQLRKYCKEKNKIRLRKRKKKNKRTKGL